MRLIKPTMGDFWTALIRLILPQIPLTIGNGCVGTAETCTSLFTDNSQLTKAKAGKFAFSMEIMNLPTGFSALCRCVIEQEGWLLITISEQGLAGLL